MYLEIIIAVSGRSLGFVGSSGRYLAFVGSSRVDEVLCTYYAPSDKPVRSSSSLKDNPPLTYKLVRGKKELFIPKLLTFSRYCLAT